MPSTIRPTVIRHQRKWETKAYDVRYAKTAKGALLILAELGEAQVWDEFGSPISPEQLRLRAKADLMPR